MSDDDTPDVFDREYVSQLRSEAGKYRQQVKELKASLQEYAGLEAQVQEVRVENELVRRGVQADPSWVKLNADESPADAVDRFLEKHPQFVTGANLEPEDREQAGPVDMPKAMPRNPSKANIPGPPAKGAVGHRSLDEVKKDPVARQTLREQYRDLLKQGSHQTDQDF